MLSPHNDAKTLLNKLKVECVSSAISINIHHAAQSCQHTESCSSFYLISSIHSSSSLSISSAIKSNRLPVSDRVICKVITLLKRLYDLFNEDEACMNEPSLALSLSWAVSPSHSLQYLPWSSLTEKLAFICKLSYNSGIKNNHKFYFHQSSAPISVVWHNRESHMNLCWLD